MVIRAVKYSIAFDGLLSCSSNVFTNPKYSSEDIALPEALPNHVKQEVNHQNIYVMDRGFQFTGTMKSFTNNSVAFIVKARENRTYVELESLFDKKQDADLGELTLVKDSKVFLYRASAINNKKAMSITEKNW